MEEPRPPPPPQVAQSPQEEDVQLLSPGTDMLQELQQEVATLYRINHSLYKENKVLKKSVTVLSSETSMQKKELDRLLQDLASLQNTLESRLQEAARAMEMVAEERDQLSRELKDVLESTVAIRKELERVQKSQQQTRHEFEEYRRSTEKKTAEREAETRELREQMRTLMEDAAMTRTLLPSSTRTTIEKSAVSSTQMNATSSLNPTPNPTETHGSLDAIDDGNKMLPLFFSVKTLVNENAQLRAELNQIRGRNGESPLMPPLQRPSAIDMGACCSTIVDPKTPTPGTESDLVEPIKHKDGVSLLSSPPVLVTQPQPAAQPTAAGSAEGGSLKEPPTTKSEQTRNRPLVVMVLGGPGSGKGTVCDRLVAEYGFIHLSAGDLLREEVRDRGDSDLAVQIKEHMKNGTLVPSTVILPLLRNKILPSNDNEELPTTASTSRKVFLVDGFPRAVDQAELFEKEVSDPTLVIFLDCDEETMVKRLRKRGETSGRVDDNEEVVFLSSIHDVLIVNGPVIVARLSKIQKSFCFAQTIKKRFVTFQNESLPVLDHYKAKNLSAVIDAKGSPDEVFRDVKSVVDQILIDSVGAQ
ncbi:cytidine monophosphate (UMP-CMP) kinase 1, cytosolic [Quaeritorhiza haematococci]|nr:cytidine monophosphate (UMP-CMP) kinase 1, cytosolic [Quaeritorhiza haematococci]